MTAISTPVHRAAFRGPRGTFVREALLDTGASQAILSQNDADRLGLSVLTTEPVHTDGGIVSWDVASAAVSVDGRNWHMVPVWIAPEADSVPTTLGWATMKTLGYRLEPPSFATTYPVEGAR